MDFFDIKTVFFTIWGYDMSYLELAGVVTGLVAVGLSARANHWGWPIGLVSVALFVFIFYQVQLYPDMFLQVFFFITNLLGWWRWTHPLPQEADKKRQLKISFLSLRLRIILIGTGLMATLLVGFMAENLHDWFAYFFPLPGNFPYADSFVMVMSVIATFLMIHKKIECWILWIVVDILATTMYFAKDIALVGLEYIFFTLIACWGLRHWLLTCQSYKTDVSRAT